MVDNGDVFHPLRWTAADAYRFLQAVPQFEAAGLVVRLPASWKTGRPPRPRATATVGTKAPSGLGTSALLDFQHGRHARRRDADAEGDSRRSLAAADGLHLVRGRWVEVKRDALRRMIDEFERVERLSKAEGVTFAEAMRLVAGAVPARRRRPRRRPRASGRTSPRARGCARRSPDCAAPTDSRAPSSGRPRRACRRRCGRTRRSASAGSTCFRRSDSARVWPTTWDSARRIQVLALLRRPIDDARPRGPGTPRPARIPRSSSRPPRSSRNWTAEMARFTPALRVLVAHPSAMPPRRISPDVDPAIARCHAPTWS